MTLTGDLSTLIWYGPGAGALVDTGSCTVAASIAAWGTVDAAIAGMGIVTGADATRLVNSPATITASGALLSADVIADGKPSLTVSIGARPSAFDVAQAVWGSDALSLAAAGTMGKKLNDAGSGANPWTEPIEVGMTAAQAMRLIAAALAGKISGADGSTVTIRNAVADNTNRIVATVDDFGNRTAITVDLD